MRVSDKRHAVGRKLLPKTPRWQEKEIQRLCKDERRVREAPRRDDRKEESRNSRDEEKGKSGIKARRGDHERSPLKVYSAESKEKQNG